MSFNWGRAIAGGVAGGLEAYGNHMIKRDEETHKAEIDDARALRDESYKIAAEERAAARKNLDESEKRANTVSDKFRVDGQDATDQQVLDSIAANGKAKSLIDTVNKRKEAAAGEVEQGAIDRAVKAAGDKAQEDAEYRAANDLEGGKPFDPEAAQYDQSVLDEINQARAGAGPTEEEAGMIKSVKKVSRIADETLAAKQAHDTDKFRMKVEQELKVLEAKQSLTREEGQRKSDLAILLKSMGGGSGRDLRMTENQRQVAATNARKAMQKAETLEEAESINSQLAEIGMNPIPVPSSLKTEDKKRKDRDAENERLKRYKAKRGKGQALIDALPFTPSAKERATSSAGYTKSDIEAEILKRGLVR